MVALKNKKADEELDELFDKIVNRSKIFKMLINTVSDIIEQKGINNIIKSIKFVLVYVALNKNDSYSESDSKQEFSDSEFSDTEGSGLKILTPNRMLSRLPITLAQLKAGKISEKLKNEIRQLLYFLYRSTKLTKQLYKSLIDIF